MSGVTTKPYLSNAPWIARSKNFPPSPSCNGSRIATQGICWTWQWEIRIFILLTPNPRKLTSMKFCKLMDTCIHIYLSMCMYVYIYYIYIERERLGIFHCHHRWSMNGSWLPAWIMIMLISKLDFNGFKGWDGQAICACRLSKKS